MLIDTRKRAVTPTEDFAVPASAGDDEPVSNTGRLKKRRAAKEAGR